MFRRLPHLDEVSIGHALVSHALFVGLERSVRDYLEVLAVNVMAIGSGLVSGCRPSKPSLKPEDRQASR